MGLLYSYHYTLTPPSHPRPIRGWSSTGHFKQLVPAPIEPNNKQPDPHHHQTTYSHHQGVWWPGIEVSLVSPTNHQQSLIQRFSKDKRRFAEQNKVVGITNQPITNNHSFKALKQKYGSHSISDDNLMTRYSLCQVKALMIDSTDLIDNTFMHFRQVNWISSVCHLNVICTPSVRHLYVTGYQTELYIYIIHNERNLKPSTGCVHLFLTEHFFGKFPAVTCATL